MRIATINGRAHLITDDRALDVAEASNGILSCDPQALFSRWDELNLWAKQPDIADSDAWRSFTKDELGNPVGHPKQVFAIGLNYADHASESNLKLPTEPVVFTKFVSSFSSPNRFVTLSGDTVDWEAELVAVIGKGGRNIPAAVAMHHVAGYAVGQDLSDRTIQWWAPPAQFSLGKSLDGFAPIGPWVVSLDEISETHDPEDLAIGCTLTDSDGSQRTLQSGRTSQMIFTLPVLIKRLSEVVELYPGDVIFSGTPAGVGMGMTPPTYLVPGQTLTTTIEGVGTITQHFVGGSDEQHNR